jgi:fatty-acyl-CoA synthase
VLRDRWLLTGDVGWVDAAGRLYVRTRERPMIKRGGHAIASADVEVPLSSLQYVNAVAAVGVPLDVSLTEDLVVVIETSAASTGDLVTLGTLSDMIIREAVLVRPGRILLVRPKTIPRTILGNVRYADLRDMVASGEIDTATLHAM